MTGVHDANHVPFRGRHNVTDDRTWCTALDLAADVLAVSAAMTPLAVRHLSVVTE